MIILLYGKDTYRLREKSSEIISEYKKKYQSGLNLQFFDKKSSFKSVKDYGRQVSMFDEKRLVVVQNSFSLEEFKKDVAVNIEELTSSKNIFLFLEEGEIRKNDKLLKALLEKKKNEAIIQEFEPLSGKKLFSWIKKEFKDKGVTIEDGAVSKLQSIGGDDLWRVKNEIDKLSLYKKEINETDLDSIVKIEADVNIFKTIDALAEKNKEKALLLFYDHLEKGDNPLYIFSMIAYQFRNLIIVSDLKRKNLPYDLMKSRSGLHPFVFKKTFHQVTKFSFEDLEKIYNKMFEADLKIKTGQIDPVLAIHLLLFED